MRTELSSLSGLSGAGYLKDNENWTWQKMRCREGPDQDCFQHTMALEENFNTRGPTSRDFSADGVALVILTGAKVARQASRTAKDSDLGFSTR